MRALSLILSHPDFTVRGVTTSEGSLLPDEGAEKVASLLADMGKTGVPVVPGNSVTGIDPDWRTFNRSFTWGKKEAGEGIIKTGAAEFMVKAVNSEKENITVICLGSLTNINNALSTDQSIGSKIDRIIWYNESVDPLKGFNYECDRESAEKMMRGKIRIDVISLNDSDPLFFDIQLSEECKKTFSQPALAMNYVHSQRPVVKKLRENHFRFADDLVALYMAEPELFYMNIFPGNLKIRYNSGYNAQAIRQVMTDLIRGEYRFDHNVVFNGFPVDPELFAYDIRQIIDSAIYRYGLEEWKANVMTDEFHGHLGVFSIVGAKMGIKARELFDVGPDMMDVVSYTGSKPPYSCLTDGIQVSTGATLGMGTIRLAGDGNARPSAVFTCNGRSIRITLKKEYLEMVDADIDEALNKFGLSDHGYWELVRHNAIRYWLEWDRDEIFDISFSP